MTTNYPSDKIEFLSENPTPQQQHYMSNNENGINVYSVQNIQQMNNQPNQIIVNQQLQPVIIVIKLILVHLQLLLNAFVVGIRLLPL